MNHHKKVPVTKGSMNLTDKSIKCVNEIGLMLDESNRTRVVSTSIEIAKVIIKEVIDGKKIILRDENGIEESIKFLGLI